jgi:hypothetical protein
MERHHAFLPMHIQEKVITIRPLCGHVLGTIQYSRISISNRTQQDKDDDHIWLPLYKTLSTNPECQMKTPAMGSCWRCPPLASEIRRDAFAFQFFCLILIQVSLADEAGRLQDFSRSRMEMQHDRIDSKMLTSWSMDHPIYVGPQDGLKKVDKISELPGQPGNAVFDQYAGYVTVDATSGKALFYYFVEAAEEPSTKPLVLWLNGGKEHIDMWLLKCCFVLTVFYRLQSGKKDSLS